jgi:hypothetical protein
MSKERYIVIEFERGGKIEAKLLCDKAPKTTEAIWNALPFESVAKQARAAGEETYIETSHIIKGVEPENLTKAALGSIQFATDPFNNITIYYGNNVTVQPFNGTAEVLEGSIEDLKEIGNRIWEKGFEKVKVKKIEK